MNFKPVSVLRKNVFFAKKLYEKTPSYYNAMALQVAEDELAEFFKNERKCFMVIEGGKEDILSEGG